MSDVLYHHTSLSPLRSTKTVPPGDTSTLRPISLRHQYTDIHITREQLYGLRVEFAVRGGAGVCFKFRSHFSDPASTLMKNRVTGVVESMHSV